jgi:hypothetical protein
MKDENEKEKKERKKKQRRHTDRQDESAAKNCQSNVSESWAIGCGIAVIRTSRNPIVSRNFGEVD